MPPFCHHQEQELVVPFLIRLVYQWFSLTACYGSLLVSVARTSACIDIIHFFYICLRDPRWLESLYNVTTLFSKWAMQDIVNMESRLLISILVVVCYYSR